MADVAQSNASPQLWLLPRPPRCKSCSMTPPRSLCVAAVLLAHTHYCRLTRAPSLSRAKGFMGAASALVFSCAFPTPVQGPPWGALRRVAVPVAVLQLGGHWGPPTAERPFSLAARPWRGLCCLHGAAHKQQAGCCALSALCACGRRREAPGTASGFPARGRPAARTTGTADCCALLRYLHARCTARPAPWPALPVTPKRPLPSGLFGESHTRRQRAL